MEVEEETESNDADDKRVGTDAGDAGPIESCDDDFYEDGDADEEDGILEESYSNFMNAVLTSEAHTSLF